MIEALEFLDHDFPWMLPAFAFVFGTIVGSFLNVCIYRIPAGRSVVFPGSTCSCGEPIPFYHNIPVLSWCILRGRAHCCDQKFSVRYPAIEFLTGVLFAVCWLQHTPVVAILGMLFVAFLICATFIDFDHMIIPDRFSIGGMVIGVLLSFAFPVLHAIEAPLPIAEHIESGVMGIVGAIVGAGLVYWISVLGEVAFRKPAMGEGDVKFVGFIGAFCGWQGAVFAMFGGALIGSVVLLPLLMVQRLRGGGEGEQVEEALPESSDGDGEDDEFYPAPGQVPFGPMLAVAGLIYFLGFSKYVDAYFNEFTEFFIGY